MLLASVRLPRDCDLFFQRSHHDSFASWIRKKSENSKDEAKAKARLMPKRSSTFLDTVLFARPGSMRWRIAGGMRAPRAGKTLHLLRPTPAANTTTEPSITGMLMQSDEGETVLYPVTKREPSREEFLVDSGAAGDAVPMDLSILGKGGKGKKGKGDKKG